MRRLAVGAAVLLALLPACAGTDRPEGVVERWLISLNQGAAGRPGQYAADALSERLLPGWRGRDPGDLTVIEVGKGRMVHRPYGIAKGRSLPRYAVVPYRIARASGVGVDGEAVVGATRGGWRIVAIGSREPSLRVPSEGGPELASATAGEWLAGVGIGLGLALGVVALMTLAPKPEPLPRRE